MASLPGRAGGVKGPESAGGGLGQWKSLALYNFGGKAAGWPDAASLARADIRSRVSGVAGFCLAEGWGTAGSGQRAFGLIRRPGEQGAFRGGKADCSHGGTGLIRGADMSWAERGLAPGSEADSSGEKSILSRFKALPATAR